jgi:hypothetical protein
MHDIIYWKLRAGFTVNIYFRNIFWCYTVSGVRDLLYYRPSEYIHVISHVHIKFLVFLMWILTTDKFLFRIIFVQTHATLLLHTGDYILL